MNTENCPFANIREEDCENCAQKDQCVFLKKVKELEKGINDAKLLAHMK